MRMLFDMNLFMYCLNEDEKKSAQKWSKTMKIAVFFPGIGYHCDKPLLYYSGKIAGQYQYELCRVNYVELSRSLDEAFAQALAQAEELLAKIDWSRYEDILFVSKSVGTVVAAAYAKRHGIKCKNIYYTPVEQTFMFDPQHGIVFHGTDDSWVETSVVTAKCREYNLPMHIIEGVNHSLEAQDDAMRNLRILQRVMELTKSYVADRIWYRRLETEDLHLDLFSGFIRHQEVTKCRRKEEGKWVIKDDPFIDDWIEADYQTLIECLTNTVNTGGFVYAGFCGDALKGFVSVESTMFGGGNKYLDLSSLHVSEDMRRKGMGRILFLAAAEWAKQRDAEKLYISSHSALETQSFYRTMGCTEAQEYNLEHVEKEPYDCQLEYLLS